MFGSVSSPGGRCPRPCWAQAGMCAHDDCTLCGLLLQHALAAVTHMQPETGGCSAHVASPQQAGVSLCRADAAAPLLFAKETPTLRFLLAFLFSTPPPAASSPARAVLRCGRTSTSNELRAENDKGGDGNDTDPRTACLSLSKVTACLGSRGNLAPWACTDKMNVP